MYHVNFFSYLAKSARKGNRIGEKVIIAGREMNFMKKNDVQTYDLGKYIPGAGVWYFRTNNHGFRGDDFDTKKPPGTYRILFIGGSTTMWGSKNETTVTAFIKKKIKEELGFNKIEVINLGIAHNSSNSSLFLFKNEYLKFSPDMVILYHFFNDLAKFTPMAEIHHEKIFHSVLLGTLNDLYLEWFKVNLAERYLKKAKYAIHTYTLNNFNEFYKLSKKHNFKLILSTFAQPDVPNLSDYEFDYFDFDIKLRQPWFQSLDIYYQADNLFNRELKEFCKDRGIVFTDVDKAVKGGLEYFTDVCHMTDEGNLLKSDETYRTIKKFLPVN